MSSSAKFCIAKKECQPVSALMETNREVGLTLVVTEDIAAVGEALTAHGCRGRGRARARPGGDGGPGPMSPATGTWMVSG